MTAVTSSSVSFAQPVPGVVLRPLRAEDAPAAAALSRAVFAMPWPEQAFRHEARDPHTRAWVAVPAAAPQGPLLGFVVLWLVADEAEIATLAVDPAWQGRGLGRALLHQALEEACARAHAVFLEVREDNAPALALYRKAGFQVVGRRRKYYRTPQGAVDARLMRLDCVTRRAR